MPIISIVGTKGGTGKSTVSMGIATWLAKMQPKKWTLLVDGDIHVRTVEFKMCPGTDVTLSNVLEGDATLEDAIYLCQLEADGKPLYPRLAVLPAGGRFLPPMSGNPVDFIDKTKRRFDRMISRLRKHFSYIIVDTPASMSFEHLILTAIADGIVYVVMPNLDSIVSTHQTAKGLEEFMGSNALGVVINQVPPDADVDGWIKQASRIAPVLGTIPQDAEVDRAFRRDLPIVAADPTAAASQAMERITSELFEREIKPTKLSAKFERAMQKSK